MFGPSGAARDNARMADVIFKYAKNYHGDKVVAAYYAISPAGHLIECVPDAPLKDGWRYATQADIDAKVKAADADKAKK